MTNETLKRKIRIKYWGVNVTPRGPFRPPRFLYILWRFPLTYCRQVELSPGWNSPRLEIRATCVNSLWPSWPGRTRRVDTSWHQIIHVIPSRTRMNASLPLKHRTPSPPPSAPLLEYRISAINISWVPQYFFKIFWASCERVFSSSKETCTPRRNRVSRVLLEALQVLKYSYRSERLSFVEDLSIAKEADYIISGQLTESAIDELMAAGKYGELEELIKNMHKSL